MKDSWKNKEEAAAAAKELGVMKPAMHLRGQRYDEIAEKCIQQYPIGTREPVQDFNRWLSEIVPGKSDLNKLRSNINRAASHPRRENGFQLQYIHAVHKGGTAYIEVRSIPEHIDAFELADKIKTYVEGNLRILRFCREQLTNPKVFNRLTQEEKFRLRELASASEFLLSGIQRDAAKFRRHMRDAMEVIPFSDAITKACS